VAFSRSGANRKPCCWFGPRDAEFARFKPLRYEGFYVIGLKGVGLAHGSFGPTLAGEQKNDRVERDAEVKPERGVMDIPVVERALFFGGHQIAAIDLGPTGNARSNRESQVTIGRLIPWQ
jgi:hypothetical protein